MMAACGGPTPGSGNGSLGSGNGGASDAGLPDAGSFDAGIADAGLVDAGSMDAGSVADAGSASRIVAISLSQRDIRIPLGASTAFAVTGTQADGMRIDVSQQSQAVSSNPAVATVEIGPGSQIQVHSVSQGAATITVTVGSLQQTCAVTVNRY